MLSPNPHSQTEGPRALTVLSCAVIGLDAELVRVEVDIATGLERVTVGLPDAAVEQRTGAPPSPTAASTSPATG